MAFKNNSGFEALRLVVFRPLTDPEQKPPYDEFIGTPNIASLVFKENYVELYMHDGYTPGGWLVAGGTITGASYLDCDGHDLPSGSRVAQCSDLIDYIVASADVSTVVATTSASGATTYNIKVGLSHASNNALVLKSDGLYVAPAAAPEAYVLNSCADEALPAGTKVAQCDEVPAQGYATYTLNGGGGLSRVEPGLMAAVAVDADVFATAELQFQNSDGVLLFTVDVAAMLNQLATTVINRVRNVAKDPLMLTVTENTTLTIEQITAAGYSGLIVLVDSASAVVLTIPNVAPGKSFAIMQIGTGSVSFAGDGTTLTVNAPSDTTCLPRTQYSAMTLLCTGADTWIAMGDMGAAQ